MIQITMIVGYLALTAIVSLYFAKRAKQNTSAFYTASRSMPMIVVSALLFSEIIAGAGTIGNAANAYTGGLSTAVWANWGMALGCFLVAATVSKFYRAMSVGYGAMTIPEAFAVMFGQRVRTLMMFIVALVYVILYSSQATAASTILAPLFGVDEALTTWLFTAFFILIAIFGGMFGISWMGVVHTAVMFIGVLIVAVASVSRAGGMDVLTSELPESFFSVIGEQPANTLASALGTAISFLASSNVTSALFGAKSKRSANWGIVLAGIMVIPFAVLPALTGMCARVTLPDISASSALFRMADSLGPVYSGILSMAIIAAIWSTGPTLLLIVSATMTKDLYLVALRKNATEKQQLRFSYAVIIVAGIVGTWLGMNGGSILDNMLGAFQIRSIVGIVLLAALVWPRVNGRAAFWSMLGGGTTAALWFFAGNPWGVAPLWPGAMICFVVLIPMTMVAREKVSEGYSKYMEAQGKLDMVK